MHAAQGAAVAAHRAVDLHGTGLEPRLGDFSLAEVSCKKASLVLALIELDQIGALEPSGQELHGGPSGGRNGDRHRQSVEPVTESAQPNEMITVEIRRREA